MKHTWKKIESPNNRTYLLAVDVPNPADLIHVDTHDPNSRGYGGSMCHFTLEDGSVYDVRGPWHTNSEALLRDTGLDIRHLHATEVTIYAYDEEPREFKEHVRQEDGTLKWMDVTKIWPCVKVENILYTDGSPVLGEFKRGEVIAQAMANLRGEPVYCDITSNGGGTRYWVKPLDNEEVVEGHRVTKLSPEQTEVVER